MATRKNGKEAQAQTEVVENVEVSEVANVVETNEVPEMKTETETAVAEVIETPEVVETETEQELIPEVAQAHQLTGVEIICSDCDDLDIEELKQVIDYCANRIDELQREEVEALEEQMRAIQDKLLALKGFRGKPVNGADKSASASTNGEKRTRTEKVVINPENPNEVYRFGKMPAWLTALCEKTGKQVWELRVDCPQ